MKKKINEVSNEAPNIQRLTYTQEDTNAKPVGSVISMTNSELMEWSRRMGLQTESERYGINKKARNITKKIVEDITTSTNAGKRNNNNAGEAGIEKSMEKGPEYIETQPWMSDKLKGGATDIRSGIS